MTSFDLLSEQTYTTECPQCVHLRQKKRTKTLTVHHDDDGITRYRCNHEGQCEWNQWQSMATPSDLVTKIDYTQIITEHKVLPKTTVLPETYNGNKLWWYRNYAGEVLYAVMRKNEINGVFVDGAPDDHDQRTGKAYFPVGLQENGQAVSLPHWPRIRGFYGSENIEAASTILVVEGEKTRDVAQRLFPKVAAITWRGGAGNFSSGDWDTEKFIGKNIYLWSDNDGPGHKAMNSIASLIKHGAVFMVDVSWVPSGKKDLADDLDFKQVQEAIKTAKLINKSVVEFSSVSDIDQQESLLNAKFDLGWNQLKDIVQFPSSGIVVLEGRKGHAKTGSAVNICARFIKNGGTVSYFIYEFPTCRLRTRFYRLVEVETNDMGQARSIVDEWIQSGKLRLRDRNWNVSFKDLLNYLDNSALRHTLVVLDYAQIIPVIGSEMRNKMMLLMESVSSLANKYGFLVLLLSQVTPDKVSPLHDEPRDSKDIHMWAEQVIRVWNKDKGVSHPVYDLVEGNYTWHILENRDGESGDIIGFSWFNGAYLEPNGDIQKFERPNHTKQPVDRMTKAIESIAQLLQDKAFLS